RRAAASGTSGKRAPLRRHGGRRRGGGSPERPPGGAVQRGRGAAGGAAGGVGAAAGRRRGERVRPSHAAGPGGAVAAVRGHLVRGGGKAARRRALAAGRRRGARAQPRGATRRRPGRRPAAGQRRHALRPVAGGAGACGAAGRGGRGRGKRLVTTVSVVIPAFNEAERLPTTLAALHGLPGLSEVIVVDDGSTDDTAEAARRAGARVIRLAQNRGKGAALQAGTAAARGDVLLLLDADVGETAGEARKLLEPVLRGEADLVIGAFPR